MQSKVAGSRREVVGGQKAAAAEGRKEIVPVAAGWSASTHLNMQPTKWAQRCAWVQVLMTWGGPKTPESKLRMRITRA